MTDFSREHLRAYIDDALTEPELARVEQALRGSEALRAQLKLVMQERDRGDHSIGAIWRRARLSCPTREQLGSYLLEALEPDFQGYAAFHLTAVGCPFCAANLADLEARRREAAPQAQQRRRRYFQSSAGLLPK